MFYETPEDWRGARRTSGSRSSACPGLGKTRIAAMLREEAGWFHYSVDFRIGTRYMGEHIVDNFKREAMRNPFLRAAAALGFDLHRLQHHLPEPRRRSRPISASPATRPRAASRSRSTCAASASTATPRSPPPATRSSSSARRARSTATTISSATPPARSARWSTRSTRPTRCCRPRRRHAAGLDPRHRGAPRRAGRPLRPRAEADVLPRGVPDPALARLLRRARASPPTRSTPTPSSATASAR